MAVHYGVKWGDTLETIAASFYGDPTLWRAIAQANNLVPPYITDRPRLRYGEPMATLLLEQQLVEGSYYAVFPSTDGLTVFRPGFRFYVEERDVAGTLHTALLAIVEYEADGHRVEFLSPSPRTFSKNSRVYIFPSSYRREMRVAGPGDHIMIPGVSHPTALSSPAPEFVLSTAEWNEAVGTDIGLAVDGTVRWDTALRDFAVIDGRDNVRQMVRGILATPHGQLEQHPEYGSDLSHLIGHKNKPDFGFLAASYSKEAIERDPRVAYVDLSRATIEQDRIIVNLVVMVSGTGLLYDVANVVLRLTEVGV